MASTWSRVEFGLWYEVFDVERPSRPVALVSGMDNADLVTAAPELLQAGLAGLEALRELTELSATVPGNVQAAIRMLDSAVERAGGAE